MKKKIKYIKV